MTRLLITRGLPASGKTTFARKLQPGVVRVNRDDLRLMLHGRRLFTEWAEGQVTRAQRATVESLLRSRADAIVDDMLEAVAGDLPYERGDRVALMINGLGGTPISELYILYRHAHRQLADRGITVGRSYVNEYCTSLDMAGASLTLVRLDDEIDTLLAAPAEVAVRVF